MDLENEIDDTVEDAPFEIKPVTPAKSATPKVKVLKSGKGKKQPETQPVLTKWDIWSAKHPLIAFLLVLPVRLLKAVWRTLVFLWRHKRAVLNLLVVAGLIWLVTRPVVLITAQTFWAYVQPEFQDAAWNEAKIRVLEKNHASPEEIKALVPLSLFGAKRAYASGSSEVYDGVSLHNIDPLAFGNLWRDDGANINVTGGSNIEKYATGPTHERDIRKMYNAMPPMFSEQAIDDYISTHSLGRKSSITGDMILTTAIRHNVDPKLIMAILERDSHFGVAGVAVKTKNPGNWGNDDSGNLVYMKTWAEGVDKVGQWLARWRINK